VTPGCKINLTRRGENNMPEAIAFFILGALISWGISHYYYHRGNKEVPAWFSVENIKEILAKNPEDINWTAKQIVGLYNKKVIDEKSSDPLPFNFCPKCGSENLKRSMHEDYEHDESYYLISCEKCGWSDWTQ
jgi:predicted nucleic-acid-binding Zn-ribbon protein